ncbi:MAG: restriction endonuclease [Roseomonas sp.]|nr:restriction endonuclease [Roseomonas sp.]MCA3297877.1 restriction endonuclease [Roseomonas sp.]
MIAGSLLSEFFLREGMRETPEWRGMDAAQVAAKAERLSALWLSLAAMARPNEATTEQAFIRPVLDLLGWYHLPQQAAGGGNRDIPDALLFTSSANHTEAAAIAAPGERYRLAAVVVESEARETPLDRGSGKGGTPASQILRYLGLAEPASGGAVRWGLLTNGRFWRLYFHGARSRAEGFVGFDLPALLEGAAKGDGEARDLLRAFLLMFRREALEASGPAGKTFLDLALDEGRRYEQRITAALSEAVFDRVFPRLVSALAAHDPVAKPADAAWRAEAREAALILLYRLLFILYAEDRDLLPVRHAGYAAYGLRRLREQAATARDAERPLSASFTRWWDDLAALCRAIDVGDASLGLPPYNGGLFSASAAPLLGRARLPDATMGDLLDDLSREGAAGARRLINFRDLSVQQLGSIYERLLEFDVVAEGAGVTTRLNAFARKNSGSYYTPEELVRLIIRRTIGPLLDERRSAFREAALRLASDHRPRDQRLADLRRHDPAEAFLSLRVLDPAMGSGHFLVSLVDWLTDETLAAQQEAAGLVKWGDYTSPLSVKIDSIRGHIRAQAAANGWEVRDEHLDDRHLVRRIVLKRVIYGADLNPMAVELAKLSLWLHSFTVGAPLSFLDHHLRAGDSLFGEFVQPVLEELSERYGILPPADVLTQASRAAGAMANIETLSDADIAEVTQSKVFFDAMEEQTRRLQAFLDLWHADRWLDTGDKLNAIARGNLLSGAYGDPVLLANGEAPLAPPGPEAADIRLGKNKRIPASEAFREASESFAKAQALSRDCHFLHWELAFPGVWTGWEARRTAGGFDAIIGNPPWDRMKLQEVEWFAARAPEVARQQRASDRKKLVAAIQKAGGDLAAEYERAAWMAEAGARVARECGAYPLLSGGDANLYALFVERALRLVKAEGIVGLLVPSGIAADKGAAPFFRSVATTGRLGALFDFENRRTRAGLDPFFPDVDSRFKFTALIAGGAARRFDAAACAFFAQNADEAEASGLALTPEDFAAVNPNTGTAPVFRGPRDAAITLAVYRRVPVLVDQRPTPPARIWPVRYATMFHMTNDSDKFLTEAELQKAGAYRVAPNRWKKGAAEWAPLMVGRSIHIFDHRAAAVVENPESIHNPFSSAPTSDAEHQDPVHCPRPQFWVETSEIPWPAGLGAAIAFRDIARPTDVRTVIAAAVPFAAVGNTLPLLFPLLPDEPKNDASAREAWLAECDAILAIYRRGAPLLLANLNALPLDYIARQKVQSTHLNFYIVEQLPILPLEAFARPIGATTAEAMVRDHVLRLSYTAHDLKPFAEDLGHQGAPFAWDAEERLHLRARLDALFFLLYGLNRDDAACILSTFPIIQREEEAQFAGRFRSRDLILGYMAAFAAGDPDSRISV